LEGRLVDQIRDMIRNLGDGAKKESIMDMDGMKLSISVSRLKSGSLNGYNVLIADVTNIVDYQVRINQGIEGNDLIQKVVMKSLEASVEIVCNRAHIEV